MKPFWTTFYSYKGGVGRSLALSNIAALLVQRGRRVVLIDFDLEAPGLDSFDEFKAIVGKEGVVEYVASFEKNHRAPDIAEFVHECPLPSKLRGKLWIMPAGKKDGRYNVDRANLNWDRLYNSGLGEPFVENWKAAIQRHCQPDYVLVDSRTGLTDVAGICTLHFPDLVVLIFGLNEQNVKGIAGVAKTIRDSEFTHVPQLHYVASPVPNLQRERSGILDERLTAATLQLGVKIESKLRYQARAALKEKLFVLENEPDPFRHFRSETAIEEWQHSDGLVADYHGLLERLIRYNRSGLDFLSNQVRDALHAVDAGKMERLFHVLQSEFPDRPEAILDSARLKQALGDEEASMGLAHKAFELDPTYYAAFDWLITANRRKSDYTAALQVCKAALVNADRVSPKNRGAFNDECANIAMAAGDYVLAVQSFRNSLAFLTDRKRKGDIDPETVMINRFNLAEATRRATRTPSLSEWHEVIRLFNDAGETSAEPVVAQANRWQAMHIPFALTGDLPRAREALRKAALAAELLGNAEDVFTVKSYTDVPVAEFLEINAAMLAAIERGQLWDGMSIPSESSDAVRPRPRRKFNFGDE